MADQTGNYADAIEALASAEEYRGDGSQIRADHQLKVAKVHARLAQVEQLRRIADAMTATASGPEAALSDITDPEERRIKSLPKPKGYVCPVCRHNINVHRMHGCDVDNCDCGAPHGRILPGDPAPDA